MPADAYLYLIKMFAGGAGILDFLQHFRHLRVGASLWGIPVLTGCPLNPFARRGFPGWLYFQRFD